MEYWENTKERAQATLAHWQQHVPAFKVGGLVAADLDDWINDYEPTAQARTTAQDDFDAVLRGAQTSLLKMKILATRVPQLIDAQLTDNAAIQKDLQDCFRHVPRTESGILGRLRALIPVWERADIALAENGPITRPIQGVAQTAAMAKALLDGYTAQLKSVKDEGEDLDAARGALRAHDRKVLSLCQSYYQAIKNTYDPGDPIYEALSNIPIPGDTPLPETIDIDTLTQGGEEGLQVLVAYEPAGGAHATTKKVQWMVEGVDADFTHEAPLDASGNALGPFTVAQVVKVRTYVENSSGSRTSAVRTITIEEPI